MIEKVLNSLKFIASVQTTYSLFDVVNLYTYQYNKLYSREVYKRSRFTLDKDIELNVRYDSLRIVGRYVRRHSDYHEVDKYD